MTPPPPRLAAWLMARTLSDVNREREAVLGDLDEEFADLAARDGLTAARRWYRRQVLRSVVPNLRRNLVWTRYPHHPPDTGRGHMESILQDLRYAGRLLGRRRAYTTVAIGSLAIGMALPAVVFSLLNAVLLRPLPVREPHRLAVLLEVRQTNLSHNFSYPDFKDYQASQRVFDGMVAYTRSELAVRNEGGAVVVAAEAVSGSYFDVLGVPVRLGRGLSAADDASGAQPAAVVSETLWRRLGGGADFSARPIVLNEQEFMIVGVAARPFQGMEVGRNVNVWLPLHATPLLGTREALAMRERRVSWLTVIGRLRPGVSLEQGSREMTALEASIAPGAGRPQPRTLTLAPGRQGDSMLPVTAGGPLKLLFAAALLVLLVACANVSNLLLARASERSREIAVRSALGATRVRLARLVLVEALLLAASAAALAVLVARWLAGLAAPLLTRFGEPAALNVALDWRMLLFVVVIGAIATLSTGVAPVVRVLRPSAMALEPTRGASLGRRAARTHQAILVLQFALSLALVTAAVFLARTVQNLASLDTGLDMDHVVLLEVDPSVPRYDVAAIATYVDRASRSLEAYPGVDAVGFGRVIPLGFGGARTTIAVPGYEPAADEDMEINFNTITPAYFDALGIRLLEGRPFETRDSAGRQPVAIVNETMASRYWPNRSAVGQRLMLGPDSVEVVGVVPDVKYRSLREPPRPSFYLPLAQSGARAGVLHVRTARDPDGMLSGLQRTLQQVDPRVPVTTVRTLRDQAALNMNDERVAMAIGLSLGVAALALSAVGLYASMSYLVGQRTKELGVRVALGARASDLHRAVLGQGLRISIAGTAFGVTGAFVLARALESRLFGVSAVDPLPFVLGACVLAGAALLASIGPARRAATVDPLDALRQE